MKADGEGRPVALTPRGQRLRVLQVLDRWRVDDEWWREQPVSRLYWRVAPEDGRLMTLYRDLISSRWYEQEY